MAARPWPHPGPGAQHSHVIDEETEAQKVKETCPQSQFSQELMIEGVSASQVKIQAKSQPPSRSLRGQEDESDLLGLLVRLGPSLASKSHRRDWIVHWFT